MFPAGTTGIENLNSATEIKKCHKYNKRKQRKHVGHKTFNSLSAASKNIIYCAVEA